jgi:hypothetical protein
MLKFIKQRSVKTDDIPARVSTLSISWLNTQFKAVAVERGTVTASWERPGDTDDPANFESFLREAVRQTGYRGHTVSLVLAHPRLMQQLLEVPPARGAALEKLIQRQAQQQKAFPGAAASVSQTLPGGKNTQRVLLHIFPRLLIDQFIQGARAAGLHLTSVLPASAVVQRQFLQLPLPRADTALLAAETGGSTTAFAGQGDGQMLLARTLADSWNGASERLALDLNRTVLFVNQQYGVSPQSLWLFGPGAPDQLALIQKAIQFPAKLSPVAYDPFYWAIEALKLRRELAPNFLSPELQQAPQREIFARVVAVATSLLVAASLGTAAYAQLQARQTWRAIRETQNQISQLKSRRTGLQRLDAEMTRMQDTVKLVVADRPPPAAAWLLAFLGDAVPPDLVITNYEVIRADKEWKIRLAGTLQHAIKTPSSLPLSEAVRRLKTRLSGAPFYIRFAANADDAATASPSDPQTNWLARLATQFPNRSRHPNPAEPDRFVLEGAMK